MIWGHSDRVLAQNVDAVLAVIVMFAGDAVLSRELVRVPTPGGFYKTQVYVIPRSSANNKSMCFSIPRRPYGNQVFLHSAKASN